MKPRPFLWVAFIACAALSILTACNSVFGQSSGTPTPSKHILFIGNSYTYINGGLDQQLKGLAPSSETASVAVGGYTLEQHWNAGTALQTIRQGGWDYVVLQEQSQTPIFDREKFYEFATKFDGEIRHSGAKTVLLMTWERPDSVGYGVTTANLAAAVNALGAQLGARVAPAGSAFALSLRERPDLTLYSQDGHPTVYGTYLAACVLYATIFGQTPAGNQYADMSIDANTRAYFQHIAAQSLGY